MFNVRNSTNTRKEDSIVRYLGYFGIEAIELGVINDTIHSVGKRTTVKEVEGLCEVFEDLIGKF